MQDLGSVVTDNMVELMLDLVPYLPGGKAVSEPGFVRIECDLPNPLFNSVQRTNLDEQQAKEKAEATAEHYRSRGLPLSWAVYPGCAPENLSEILVSSGFEYNLSSPGMALTDLQTYEPPSGWNLDIRPAVSAQDFLDLKLPFDSFKLGEQVTDAIIAAFAHPSSAHKMVNYVGRSEGKPVSSGALYYGRTSAGIYNIATVPEARGRGYGSAMTSHLLQIAKAKGYERAVLVSSKMGYSVYQKLGFKEVVRFDYYGIH